MTEHRDPTAELKYQTQLLEHQARLLDRVSKNSQITAIASLVYMVIVALQCLVVALYVAGVISIARLLSGGR